MALVPLANNSAVKHQEVSINVTTIRNQNETEDLCYLTVNILRNTSTI